jgi:hypothetical protein
MDKYKTDKYYDYECVSISENGFYPLLEKAFTKGKIYKVDAEEKTIRDDDGYKWDFGSPEQIGNKFIYITKYTIALEGENNNIPLTSSIPVSATFKRKPAFPEKKITLYRKDNQVIAKCNGKTAVAKCNLSLDDFDYYTGCRIALDRLFGVETNTYTPEK